MPFFMVFSSIKMVFEGRRDCMDQDISAGLFPAADSGPSAQSLAYISDWINMTKEGLDLTCIDPAVAY